MLVARLDGSDPFKDRPHVDFVTHGRRVVMHMHFPMDDGSANCDRGPAVRFPIWKSGLRDRALEIPGAGSLSTDLPEILANGDPYQAGRRTA